MRILKWIGIVIGGLGCFSIIVVGIVFIWAAFLFRSIDCDTTEVFNVTGHYRLSYFCEKRSTALYYNLEEEYGGSMIVGETVFQVDWNEEWIIARQYPNLEEQIHERLFNHSKETGDYELTDPNDTIYLAPDDRIYQKNGKWYHISNGWNPPDSLFPYKGQINYYIINAKLDERVLMVDSKEGLAYVCDSLNIPAHLDKQIIFEDLK